MRLTLFFHALWMLCAMGTTVLAVVPDASVPLRSGAFLLGFVLAVAAMSTNAIPDPAWVGLLVAIVAVGHLFRPRIAPLTLLIAGALAGLWSALLQVQGLPASLAFLVAAVLPGAATLFSIRRPVFAPATLKDEALLIIVVLAAATALGPGVADGWRSASALNLESPDAVVHAVPGWTIAVVAGTTALGGLYSLWVRR